MSQQGFGFDDGAPRVPSVPDLVWKTIAMDPPWPENGGGKVKRGADRHYKTMPVSKIYELVPTVLGYGYDQYGRISSTRHVAADAHCWIWTTSNYRREGQRLMELLGFDYKCDWVWIKLRNDCETVEGASPCDVAEECLQTGLGQYGRKAHEYLLFGSRGKAQVPPTDFRPPSVFFAPRVKKSTGRDYHSAKPDVWYDIVEQVSPGPYLELFSRKSHGQHWTPWGNEVGKRDATEACAAQ